MAVAAVGVLIVGFAPSVYARLPQTMPAMLVATHHVRIHRWLGIVGVVLATVMVVSAPPMAVGLARRGGPRGSDPLMFMLVIVVDVLLFAAFFGSAIWFRRRGDCRLT